MTEQLHTIIRTILLIVDAISIPWMIYCAYINWRATKIMKLSHRLMLAGYRYNMLKGVITGKHYCEDWQGYLPSYLKMTFVPTKTVKLDRWVGDDLRADWMHKSITLEGELFLRFNKQFNRVRYEENGEVSFFYADMPEVAVKVVDMSIPEMATDKGFMARQEFVKRHQDNIELFCVSVTGEAWLTEETIDQEI